jgi:hypothetical protein
MLSKVLYDLCHLLSTPYDNLNLVPDMSPYINHLILEKIYLDKLQLYKYRKFINSILENIHFTYKYSILEKNKEIIKLKLNLRICFKLKNAPTKIISSYISEYITILEHLQNNFKMQLLIENEDNPILYNYLLDTPLSRIKCLKYYKDDFVIETNFPLINSTNETFNTCESSFYLSTRDRDAYSFNILSACTYAEAFALTPNPEYKYFEGIGGDCTNFASQILYSGGLKKNKIWAPYTNSWIRVQELYSYLINNNLAIKVSNDSLLSKGDLIQFYTPKIGRYFHNGFITYKLPNNDCLYCCHSYNKLNYPLSEIYPNKYPTLRALRFQ